MSLQECTQPQRLNVVAEPSDAVRSEAPPPLPPASLRVFRYCSNRLVRAVIGSEDDLPPGDLIGRAAEALRNRTFIFYTVAPHDKDETEELCFVPRGIHCDILSIRTHGWHKRGADARRSLLDVLSDVAAAVACGTLAVLDADEISVETKMGEEVLQLPLTDGRSLAVARETAQRALRHCQVDDGPRSAAVLAISEAATNVLLHGGGHGLMTLRILPDRLRFIVSDYGTGLSFRNWRERACVERDPIDRPVSMGYGFKIMLDHLDAVGLHSGPWGTTLVLDRTMT